MNDIKTTNLISTPNIEGNIGSCKTESVKEKTYSGVVVDQYRVIMTNSCTGEVIKDYEYRDYENVGPLIFLVSLCVALMALGIAAIVIEEKRKL